MQSCMHTAHPFLCYNAPRSPQSVLIHLHQYYINLIPLRADHDSLPANLDPDRGPNRLLI